MTYFILEESELIIEFGSDQVRGVYLTVSDKRLKYDHDVSQETNEVARSVDPSEKGIYLNIYTGESSSLTSKSKKVSKETIKELLIKYGVLEDQLNELFKSTVKPSKCFVCKNETTKNCQQCHSVTYCSRDCQAKDWKIHKFFCKNLPFPVQPKDKTTVTAVYLSEISVDPILVRVPLKRFETDYESFILHDSKGFLHDTPGRSYMQTNPLKPHKSLKDTLMFEYHDNFFNDGSKDNICIKRITNNMNPHPWKGPMLITKQKGHYGMNPNPSYLDVEVKDFEDIIDFLLSYGSY